MKAAHVEDCLCGICVETKGSLLTRRWRERVFRDWGKIQKERSMPDLVCEYEIGTRAKIAVGDDVEGTITAVVFRSESYYTYELTWVHDGALMTGWFLPIELKVSS